MTVWAHCQRQVAFLSQYCGNLVGHPTMLYLTLALTLLIHRLTLQKDIHSFRIGGTNCFLQNICSSHNWFMHSGRKYLNEFTPFCGVSLDL